MSTPDRSSNDSKSTPDQPRIDPMSTPNRPSIGCNSTANRPQNGVGTTHGWQWYDSDTVLGHLPRTVPGPALCGLRWFCACAHTKLHCTGPRIGQCAGAVHSSDALPVLYSCWTCTALALYNGPTLHWHWRLQGLSTGAGLGLCRHLYRTLRYALLICPGTSS